MPYFFKNIPIKSKTFYWEQNKKLNSFQKNQFSLKFFSFENSDEKKMGGYGFTFLKKIISSLKRSSFFYIEGSKKFSGNSILIFWRARRASKMAFFFSIQLLIGQNFFILHKASNGLFFENKKDLFLVNIEKKSHQIFPCFYLTGASIFFSLKEKKILTFLKFLLKKL